MTRRALPQVTISFLFGILGSYYGKTWIFLLGMCWVVYLGVTWCRQSPKPETTSQKKKTYGGLILKICLLFFVCMVGYGRCEKHQQTINNVEEYLKKEDNLTVIGTVYKKEEKNDYILYYLKNSYIICNDGYISCNRILVYPNADIYSIGDTIQVEGTYQGFHRAVNEGDFDEKSYYHSKNILFRIEENTSRVVKQVRFSIGENLYQMRKKINNVYLTQLQEKEAGVLSVMTLGDKEFLNSETKKLYQRSGISHVLAISGLHVSIIGMGLYKFLRNKKFSYLCSSILSGSLVWVFGLISGMEVSTERAVIMFLVMLLGNVLGMAYDTVTALSLSALLQMWQNSYCLWNAGFLFSYSAVLAVVVVAKIIGSKSEGTSEKKQPGVKGLLAKCKHKLVETLFISSSIQLVTLPLTAYFYYELPVYSILINGLLLPFMGVLLMSGILGGLAGLFIEGLSWILLRPAAFLLKWNERICERFEKLPGANWITGRPHFIIVVLYYIILVTVLLFLYKQNQREDNDENKVNRKYECRKKTGSIFLLIIALVFVLMFRLPKGFRLCFLDVGQGDGICIQEENGTVFFLDGGSTSEKKVGEYRILSFLKYNGISHVDGWFVSHADQDHVSGLLEVWESGYTIKYLFLADKIVKDESWQELCRYAKKYGTKIIYLQPGEKIEAGKLHLTCLMPLNTGADRNENSLVLFLEYNDFTGIFTGDISSQGEKVLLQTYPDLQADVYKAAHHGSDGSSSEYFLEQINPALTVVSCSKKNSYGHPGKRAVDRIETSGSRIMYTMESGQITVRYHKGKIYVKEYLFAKP